MLTMVEDVDGDEAQAAREALSRNFDKLDDLFDDLGTYLRSARKNAECISTAGGRLTALEQENEGLRRTVLDLQAENGMMKVMLDELYEKYLKPDVA